MPNDDAKQQELDVSAAEKTDYEGYERQCERIIAEVEACKALAQTCQIGIASKSTLDELKLELREKRRNHVQALNNLNSFADADDEKIQRDAIRFEKIFFNAMNTIDQKLSEYQPSQLQNAMDELEAIRIQLQDFITFQADCDEVDHEAGELMSMQDDLKPLAAQYKTTYYKMYKLLPDDRQASEENKRVTFTQQFHKLNGWFNSKLNSLKQVNSETISVSKTKKPIKLPQAEVPSYDGTPEKWIRFRDSFNSLIHTNNDIEDINKFTYLEQALKAIPSHENVLNNYAFSSENYSAAWKAVCENYNDKSLILSSHLISLFNTKKATTNSAAEIKRLINAFTSNLSALEKLGYKLSDDDDFANLIIVHMMTFRLDDITLLEWKKDNTKDVATWKDLYEFLFKLWKRLNEMPSSSSKKTTTKDTDNKPVSGKTNKSFASTQSTDVKCPVCAEPHRIYACSQFKNSTVDERRKIVASCKLCFNCMRSGHSVSECQSEFTCRVSGCNKKHNSLLHLSESTSDANNTQPSTSKPTPYKPPPVVVVKSSTNVVEVDSSYSAQTFVGDGKSVLLDTVKIWVLGVDGNWNSCRALLDSGSTNNFMTSRCAKRLGLSLEPASGSVAGISGNKTVIRKSVITSIASKWSEYQLNNTNFSILNDITGLLPHNRINSSAVEVPHRYPLADPEFHTPAAIDLLYLVNQLPCGVFVR